MLRLLLLLLLFACTMGAQESYVELSSTQESSSISNEYDYRSFSYGEHSQQVLDVFKEGEEVQATVIIVHGGAWEGIGKKENMRSEAQVFVDAGYTAITPGYRLMYNHSYPDSESDIACVLATVYEKAEELKIDRENIILLGYSAGTYTTSQVIFNFNESWLDGCLYKKINVKGYIGMSGSGFFSDINIDTIFNYDANRSEYYNNDLLSSSYDMVDGSEVPSYFLVGSEDLVARPEVIQVMYERCVESGLETDFTIIDGVGHGGVLDNEYARQVVLDYATRIIT